MTIGRQSQTGHAKAQITDAPTGLQTAITHGGKTPTVGHLRGSRPALGGLAAAHGGYMGGIATMALPASRMAQVHQGDSQAVLSVARRGCCDASLASLTPIDRERRRRG